jgi:porin
MDKAKVLFVITAIVLCTATAAVAEDDIWTRDTLTGGFWGLNDNLVDKGIEVGFGLTNIYQINLQGGQSTHNRQGRHSGSYDLEISTDLGALAGIEGGSFYIHGAGGFPRRDLATTSVDTHFGINADAGGRRTFDVVEVYYEQALLDETLRIRVGKLDIGGGFECQGCPVSFDGSAYANDETAQFLNGGLVNNPTIPFPDKGLGLVLYYNPIQWWYFGAGVADAQADARETGFNTAFHDEDYFFYVYETGITPQLDSSNGPLQGAYRIGLWNDPQPKGNADAAKMRSGDVGYYLSFDQMLAKENDDPEDGQGIGTFARYGYADDQRNDITNYFSFGFQYQGLFDGRDDDVLGVGFAQGCISNSADTTYAATHERAIEVYYNILVTPWLSISPSLQYVGNPKSDEQPTPAKDALVFGIRAQTTF